MPKITAEDVYDLVAFAAFLNWLADGNKAQEVLDRWPKPTAGCRLAAHWDHREPDWRAMKVPAATTNGHRINDTRFYEAVFDACIDQAHTALAKTDGLRKAASTVRDVVSDYAKTPAYAEAMSHDPTVCGAAFALRADTIRDRFGSNLFGTCFPLSMETMSYATMCNVVGGRHPMDMDTLEMGKIYFGDKNDVVCTMSYADHPEWWVTLKRGDIL